MQRLDVQIEDDLTGGPAVETVAFGIDGRSYEIDLNAQHAMDFRQRLARFVDHARLARPKRRDARTRTAANREHSRQIRHWAQSHGYEVAEHGRLPTDVVAQYESAHKGSQRSDRSTMRAKTKRRATRRLSNLGLVETSM